jgi:hypothetical protein
MTLCELNISRTVQQCFCLHIYFAVVKFYTNEKYSTVVCKSWQCCFLLTCQITYKMLAMEVLCEFVLGSLQWWMLPFQYIILPDTDDKLQKCKDFWACEVPVWKNGINLYSVWIL